MQFLNYIFLHSPHIISWIISDINIIHDESLVKVANIVKYDNEKLVSLLLLHKKIPTCSLIIKQYNAKQENSADCSYSYREPEHAADRVQSGVMDCGRKIDRLTINVIVLRGVIRQGGVASSLLIALRRVAS